MEKIYITDIYINGFQSHEDTHIELTNGFNAIIGPSNSGKSAIIRDIEFVLFNTLNDSNFMTKGHDSFSSTIVFSNGKKVTRKRTKKENIYELSEPGKETVVLTSFGKGPVKEVIEFHGIKPIKISGKEEFISVQSQHDKPFFLTDSPSEKAALVGAIAKTDAVDAAISDLRLDISRKESAAKEKKKLLEEKKKLLSVFDDLDDMEADLSIAESKETELNAYIEKKRSAEKSADSVRSYKKVFDKERDIVSKAHLIKDAETKFMSVESKIKDRDRAVALKHDMESSVAKQSACENIISRRDAILEAAKLYEFIEKNQKLMDSVENSVDALKALKDRISKEEGIVKNKASIIKAGEKLDTLIKINDIKKDVVKSSASLTSSIERHKKGVVYIAKAESREKELRNEFVAYIEKHPVCPVCGADMRGREGEVIGS